MKVENEDNVSLGSTPDEPSVLNVNGKTHDEKLLDLTNKTRYNLVQRNGQRIYGGPPPDWSGHPPEKGCEIFVGKVPRDCYEDELVPIFEKIGPLYELRLMMDFSGSNRGYCFVRYTTRDHAKTAMKELNNFEIRPGKLLGVIQSVDNRKLWISGIPKNKTALEIKSEMQHITDGVRDVILYSSQTDKTKTRGYAFVEYESHRAAALARRKLVPGRIFLFDQEIEKVDWAEPENEVDEEIMNKVKVLFVRNLLPSTNELKIRETFSQLGNGDVDRVRKAKDYAFVHFLSRESAEKALMDSKGMKLDGSPIYVEWSKPVDKTAHNTRKALTKILSQGIPVNPMFDPITPPVNMIPVTQYPQQFQSFRGIYPRKRGAAGIRGLGAPGTNPPRRLFKQFSTFLPGNGYQCNGNFTNGTPSADGSPPNGLNPYSTSLIPPHTPTEFTPPLIPHYFSPYHQAVAIYPQAINHNSMNGSENGQPNHLNGDHLAPTTIDHQVTSYLSCLTINGNSA